MLQETDSFDIFDTLLTRTVKNPIDIFDIIEKKYPYNGFKSLRLSAQDRSNHTISDIYYQFKLLTGESDDTIKKLREFELMTEMENTIPILSNILKVKDGDILVSDMYLTSAEIERLLQYHGINKKVSIFVSPDGKSSGKMWFNLKQKYNILSHTGDNIHSDITMAMRFGIKSNYTTVHNFTHLESELLKFSPSLCTIFRKLRLTNPYDENSFEYKIYDEQVQYNFPLLLLVCKQLVQILESEGRNTVLFLSRDGCLLYKIFSRLYPTYKSIYLYSSRIINQSDNQEYKNYLKSNYDPDSCLLFDLHGSFNSGKKIFMELFGELPRIFIFDYNIGGDKWVPNITYFTNISNKIECFNHDINGSLIDLVWGNTVHLPPEIPFKYIQLIHQTIDELITFIEGENILSDKIFNNSQFWKNYYQYIVYNYQPLFKNETIHSNYTLTTLANKYNSDKGDSYKCAHHYTLKYQEIISNILKEFKVEINLLEIGLNRDNSDGIPSLLMWNEYFNKNVVITGFDINPAFLKFNSVYKNIDIIIGDQSNPKDLQPLLTKQYEIIIDDGYHASKHQQITFKTLWQAVKPGGYYVIEDLHYQPESETCVKTKTLFESWSKGIWITSEYLNADDINKIRESIQSIEFFDSKSKNWNSVENALVYIKKLPKKN